MRKLREMLRLKGEARLSDLPIAAVIGSAHSTVQEPLRRARAAGIAWLLLTECVQDDLLALLHPKAGLAPR